MQEVLDMSVRMPTGEKVPVQIDTSITIGDLKTLVYAATSVPVDEQKLVYGGRILGAHHIQVQTLGFRNNGVIFLVRTRQEPPPPQEAARNPMASPVAQMLFGSPDFLRNVMMADPRLRQVVDTNPELNQLFSDPRFVRQLFELSTNPTALREMQRNQDLALSNIEMLPGGFNALQRMYNTLSALEQTMPNEHEEANNRRLAAQLNVQPITQSLNDSPLPNPWAHSDARYSEQLQSLLEMGFEHGLATRALDATAGNIDAALDYMMNNK